MQNAYFEFEAGLFVWGPVRQILESERFHGRNIRWLEGKGFLSRTFSIAGDPQDVQCVRERLQHYQRCLDAA